MIIDLNKFIRKEEKYWHELETMMTLHFKKKQKKHMTIDDVRRFDYLYRRCSADLSQLNTFSFEPELKAYLDALVGQAYSYVHENRCKSRFKAFTWIKSTIPQTVRRRYKTLLLSIAITIAGASFGAIALSIDKKAIDIVLPDADYIRNPTARVEKAENDHNYHSGYAAGSAAYFKHNTGIAIMAMGVGIAWGIGTIIVLFYNGVILGSVIFHYVANGKAIFVTAWLLPHGAFEIPAILLAGQAGLTIGNAVIGWGDSKPMATRLRECGKDVVTIIASVAIMMLLAGVIESNFSQNHEPLIPYSLKIFVGITITAFVIWYFGFCGKIKKVEE